MMKLRIKRTRKRIDEDIAFFTHFNKLLNSKKSKSGKYTRKSSSSDYLIDKHIDRIQLSVFNKSDYFHRILQGFKSSFHFIGTKNDGKRFIYKFKYQNVEIELFFGINNKEKNIPPYWFSISIHDPDFEIQRQIIKILKWALNNDEDAVSLSQVECAVDIFPLSNSYDLQELHRKITHPLVLRNMRVNSFFRIENTVYQGNKGNVRRGSKGLTGYIKDDLGCVRVELRANRHFLRLYGPTYLPVVPKDFKLRNHIEFRHGLNNDSLRKLVFAAAKINRLPSEGLTRGVVESIYRVDIQRHICDDDVGIYDNIEDCGIKPVAEQIDFFRELKKKKGLTHGLDYFFPKIAC